MRFSDFIAFMSMCRLTKSSPGARRERRAESGELFGCDRVVDAVSTLGNVEDPGDVHCGKSPCGRE